MNITLVTSLAHKPRSWLIPTLSREGVIADFVPLPLQMQALVCQTNSPDSTHIHITVPVLLRLAICREKMGLWRKADKEKQYHVVLLTTSCGGDWRDTILSGDEYCVSPCIYDFWLIIHGGVG